MAILQVDNLCKSFGKHKVLGGISFSLKKGEVLSIIGSSGSGKTTLLRCLNSLEFADNGVISVNDEVIFDASDKSKISESELRRKRLHFGLVFQNFNLFPQYTVMENVCLAPKLMAKNTGQNHSDIEASAKIIIDRVGMSQRIDAYPWQLSGGQQQRVAIARALALNPEILCFDEPTSALDPELTGEVLKVIRSLKDDGCTMIVVTHEMSFAHDVSSRILFMDNGIIAEQGDPSILENPQTDRLSSFLQKVRM